MPNSLHPSFRAFLARSIRFARTMRGHFLIARLIAGNPPGRTFRVRNASGWFEGSLESVVGEQLYLVGSYEGPLITAFLDLFPRGGDSILDVGANVGTHSIAFARAFRQVLAFEPSPEVFARLERNLDLNPNVRVTPINIGLGDVDGELPFYDVAAKGGMLGTFLQDDQYDQPLAVTGTLSIVRGDHWLAQHVVTGTKIDAIKIDVQGFEPQALRGLRETLETHRPCVWIELGNATERGGFADLFPWPFDVLRFVTRRRFGISRTWLEHVTSVEGYVGDVVVRPR